MGSFNLTCCVSNLPIEAGTPVRYLALARSAFDTKGNGHVCYVGGRWQVYGVPLKAWYNDYGSVENVEESFTTAMFFEGLKRGVVEKGVGDNQCHDVAVRADMTQKGWLEALWEGRVEVEDHPLSLSLLKGLQTGPEKEYEPPTGQPSLKRIEAVIKNAGLSVDAGYGADGYVVDEMSTGYMRVRHGRSGRDTKALGAILPLMHEAGYAAMVTVGSGNYANHAEVLVAPLPPTDPNQHIHVAGAGREQDDSYGPRPVSQAMVREDVWQILLGMEVGTWERSYRVEDLRKLAVQKVEKDLEEKRRLTKMTTQERQDYLRNRLGLDIDVERNTFDSFLSGHEGTSGFTYRQAYRLAKEQAPDPESFKQYVLELAELIFVEWAYATLYGQWHPTSNGSQEGHWPQQRAFHLQLAAIRGAWEDEEEDELDDDESDEKELTN